MSRTHDRNRPHRIHLAIATRDLDRSVAFYRALLDHEPAKIRPGYAKFDLTVPPVNLTLHADPNAVGHIRPAHFGLEVDDADAVHRAADRLRAAGLATRAESGACCYSVQEKVWTEDPDGNAWEVYTILEAEADQYASAAGECCDTDRCTDDTCAADCCADVRSS